MAARCGKSNTEDMVSGEHAVAPNDAERNEQCSLSLLRVHQILAEASQEKTQKKAERNAQESDGEVKLSEQINYLYDSGQLYGRWMEPHGATKRSALAGIVLCAPRQSRRRVPSRGRRSMRCSRSRCMRASMQSRRKRGSNAYRRKKSSRTRNNLRTSRTSAIGVPQNPES